MLFFAHGRGRATAEVHATFIIYPRGSGLLLTSLTLDEGDVRVMLTDGFFEWCRPSDEEQFGIRRLEEALRRDHAAGNASTILQSVDATVRAFCDGSAQSDDMTAIVIKRTSPANVNGCGSGLVASSESAADGGH